MSQDGSTAPSSTSAVLVLGMVRSGTSAITRLLGLLGVDLGIEDELLAPVEHVNPKGFFENQQIVRLNAELLRRMGGTWREPPVLPANWQSSAALEDLRVRAREILTTNFPGARVWGFKDPRTSLTLPFWEDLIGEARYVLCHRRPLDSARSLQRRNGIELGDGVALWTRYTASALAHTAGRRRIIISYEELFSNRESLVGELAAFLDTPGRGETPQLRTAIEEWIEDGLRHHAGTLRELIEHPAVSAHARELDLLIELAISSRESGWGGEDIVDTLDAMARKLLADEHLPVTPVSARESEQIPPVSSGAV
jgi:O-antigen biosynthesis protein